MDHPLFAKQTGRQVLTLGKMQTVEIFSRIAELPREEWDRLISTNVFATHGWLKTVEATFIGDIRPFYLLVRENGRPAGATLCYLFRKTGTVQDLDDLLLGRGKSFAARLGISFMPTMVCGTLWGCGDHLAVEPGADPERKRAMMNKLLDAAEGQADRNGFPLSLINVPEGDSELATILRQRGYSRCRHAPLTLLDLRWSSFSDYVKHLNGISRHARKNLRNEINRNRKSGTTVSVLENVALHATRLYELLTMNYRKYRNMPFCFSKDFFTELERNLGRNAVLRVSRKAGLITGVVVELKYNGTSYLSLVGVDHEQCGNDMTYFILTSYEPIAEGISAGVSRLYFGRGDYLMKIRRGCKTTDLFIWHKSRHCVSHHAARFWFALLSCWNSTTYPGESG
jgi:predicted N-acyltransferase